MQLSNKVRLALFVVVGIAWTVQRFWTPTESLTAPPDGPDPIHQIEAVRFSDLTFEQFYDFRMRDRPLLITGIPVDQSTCFGGLGAYNDTMLRGCEGTVNVFPRADSKSRRKATDDRRQRKMDIQEFMPLFRSAGGLEQHFGKDVPIFVDGLEIRKSCPSLWKSLRFPAYFTGQIRLHIPSAHHPTPTQLYFTKKGFNMSFHQDFLPSEIWLSICRGRKRYRVVPLSLVWDALGRAFDVGKFLLRPAELPLGLPVYEGVASAGDVVYIPAGALHAVDTLEDTVNVADNFVDAGELGPLSWVNVELFMRRWKLTNSWTRTLSMHWLGYMQYVGLRTPAARTKVFDGLGVVTTANATARGFPSWGDLESWGLLGY